MGICLSAGKKRLCRNPSEKLKNRTNLWKRFLLPAALPSTFFFTTVTSHAHVGYFGHRLFKIKFFFAAVQFSVTVKRFGLDSAFISATFTGNL